MEPEKSAGMHSHQIRKESIDFLSDHGGGGAAAPTNPTSIKERLLAWCQQATKGYQVSTFK